MKVKENTLYCHLFLDKSKGIYKTLKLSLADFSINIDTLKQKIQGLVFELNKVYTILLRMTLVQLSISSNTSLKALLLLQLQTKQGSLLFSMIKMMFTVKLKLK
jgi:hypothetical protein